MRFPESHFSPSFLYFQYKAFFFYSSYLHCEWKTIAELEKDKRIHMKIKRFRQKRDHANCFDTVSC